jgi:hypothetical protein
MEPHTLEELSMTLQNCGRKRANLFESRLDMELHLKEAARASFK